MRVFVDTSCLFALLDQDDKNHEAAKALWTQLVINDDDLVTTNYVVVETASLAQRRLGMHAVNEFYELLAPALRVEWVDTVVHDKGVTAMLTANRRDLSLVDCVSFAVCRRIALEHILGFDAHFAEQGFTLLRAQP